MALAVLFGVRLTTAAQHLKSMVELSEKHRNARISYRSVFDLNGAAAKGSRLAIGHFNRPLADAERGALLRAWERARLPEVEDFEVSPKQVSFLTHTPRVEATWDSIDSLLAATYSLAKAS